MRLDSNTARLLEPWFGARTTSNIRLIEHGPMCWFVRDVLRQGAMTVSPFVFYGRARYDATSLRSIALLAHELKHVEQYKRYGHVRFLARYFYDLARNRFRYSRSLPLEAECYALQAQVLNALEARFPARE